MYEVDVLLCICVEVGDVHVHLWRYGKCGIDGNDCAKSMYQVPGTYEEGSGMEAVPCPSFFV